jgi:excisionase family DNA binding protein
MWLSTKEAAKMLGISVRTVQRQISSGKLKAREIPGVGGNGLVWEVCIHEENKQPQKIKTIPEKFNDRKQTSDKNIRPTTKNNPTNDISTSDRPTTPPKSMKNKDLPETSDRPTTPTGTLTKTAKDLNNKEIAPTNDMTQCTGSPTGTPVVGIDKALINKEVKFFIDAKTTGSLTNWSRKTVFRKITSNQVISMKQPKDGGGIRTLVDVRSLPIEAQEKWKQLSNSDDTGMKLLNNNQRQYAYSMEKAIMVWLRYREDGIKQCIRKQDADRRFLNDLRSGEILEEEHQVLGGISVKTLYRNHRKWENSGRRTSVLAPDRKCNRGRKPVKASGFYALANTWILTQPAVKAAHLYNQLVDHIESMSRKDRERSQTLALPSYPTFLKFYKDVKERQKLLIAHGQGKKTLDNLMPYIPRRNDALPGNVWQYDGYILKILVRNPWLSEGLTKPVVVYFYDVATTCVTGFSISFSERSDVIAAAWYDAMTKFPAPKILQPDNPSGIYNEQLCAKYILENETRKKYLKLKQRAVEYSMNGRNGIFFDCGLERIKFVTPGNSKGKQIEAAHYHIFRQLETQPRFADVYVGKSPDDRPEHLQRTNKAILNDKKLNIPDWDWIVTEIGKHIEYYNNRKKKSLQGYSPIEAYLQMTDISKKLSSEELKYKALWMEELTPRNGYIKLFGDIMYQHPAFSVLKKVKIGYNVNDLSTLRVFNEDGREMSTPAVIVKKGSYVDDEISAEAIRANKTYKRKSIELQKEILATDIKRLSQKELIKLLDSDIGQNKKDLIQERINEIEKYPEFGKISSATKKMKRVVEDIQKEEPLPDLSYIIDAKFEEEPEEDDSWLDDIINQKEDPEPESCHHHEKEAEDKVDRTLKRLGIGGK